MIKENLGVIESISEKIKGFEWIKNQINEAWFFLIYQNILNKLVFGFFKRL